MHLYFNKEWQQFKVFVIFNATNVCILMLQAFFALHLSHQHLFIFYFYYHMQSKSTKEVVKSTNLKNSNIKILHKCTFFPFRFVWLIWFFRCFFFFFLTWQNRQKFLWIINIEVKWKGKYLFYLLFIYLLWYYVHLLLLEICFKWYVLNIKLIAQG